MAYTLAMHPNRKPLIAANWKMNDPPVGCYTSDSPFRSLPGVDVWVFLPFIEWYGAHNAGLVYGAQCGRPEPQGAFTGDISMLMLKHQHFHAVLCGHSDRRHFHQESDAFIAEQATAALEVGLIPIVCIGETEAEHDAGKTTDVLKRQLKPVIDVLTAHHSLPTTHFILAYEPVWAISRGDPNKPAATAKDAQDIHARIRSLLPKDRQATTRILYGGSMKGSNAAELLAQPDIDGGLVGGASLKLEDFRKIVEAAESR